jgi:hypothetical protein
LAAFGVHAGDIVGVHAEVFADFGGIGEEVGQADFGAVVGRLEGVGPGGAVGVGEADVEEEGLVGGPLVEEFGEGGRGVGAVEVEAAVELFALMDFAVGAARGSRVL